MAELEYPVIYCFLEGKWDNGDVVACAIAEDGTQLARHVSSSESWAKSDIGLTSDRKHDLYQAHYPMGYKLVWVNEDEESEGLGIALKRLFELEGIPTE